VASIASQYYEAARAIGGYVENSTINNNNGWYGSWYGLIGGNIIFNSPRSLADDQTQLNTYLDLLQNQTIANGEWSIFLAHEVLPFSQILSDSTISYYPVSTEWLSSLCQWLTQKSDSNEIWVETVGNITKYVKEREDFSYTLLSSDENNIQFEVTDSLDDSIYNYPLSVDVTVPYDWSVVGVQQGDTSYNADTFWENGTNYVRVHVVPNGGVLTLTNGATTFTLSGTVNYDNKAQTPIPNVKLTLFNSGSLVDSATTDLQGNYSFSNLLPGTYTITASKTDDWSGVNSTDALLITKYFVNQAVLDSLQIQAADVNNNGAVNSTDALIIAKRFTNQIQKFDRPDWLFAIPGSITITNGNVTQNIKGMAAGDVNGSF
jgi:Carboxypeptidase regulatory-like domain/Dockerin type I domain